MSAEGDLSDVSQEVVGIKSTYYQFGIALGLPSGELDSVRTAYGHLIDQAFHQVLLLWLRQRYGVVRHGPPIWRRLVEAMDSRSGGNNTALAKDIANRHPVSGMIYVTSAHFSLFLSLYSLSVSVSLSVFSLARARSLSRHFEGKPIAYLCSQALLFLPAIRLCQFFQCHSNQSCRLPTHCLFPCCHKQVICAARIILPLCYGLLCPIFYREYECAIHALLAHFWWTKYMHTRCTIKFCADELSVSATNRINFHSVAR